MGYYRCPYCSISVSQYACGQDPDSQPESAARAWLMAFELSSMHMLLIRCSRRGEGANTRDGMGLSLYAFREMTLSMSDVILTCCRQAVT